MLQPMVIVPQSRQQMTGEPTLKERYEAVRQRIADAAVRSGRRPEDVEQGRLGPVRDGPCDPPLRRQQLPPPVLSGDDPHAGGLHDLGRGESTDNGDREKKQKKKH